MSDGRNANILMLYIEPTPYVIDLIDALQATSNKKIDTFFLGENISQNWQIDRRELVVLPRGIKNQFYYIAKLLFKNQYDLIHLAGWGHPLFIFIIFYAKFARIPIVIESDTSFSHYTVFWKRFIKRLFYPLLFSLVDLFFPGGTRQVNYLKFYGVNDKHLIPVQMTVDINKIRQQSALMGNNDRERELKKYDIKPDSIVFIYVGRLVRYKGISELLTVFKQIQNEHAILIIVGDGEMRGEVESAIKTNDKIRYAGRLSGCELIKVFHSADALILPSHFEPWGLVVNEGMALGKPVIVTERVGCIDDLVTHQENGLIIRAESVVDLQHAVEYMVNSTKHRELMGKQSVAKIANWTLEIEARKIIEGWHSLICA